MKSRNQYHGILPYAVDSVRHWARRLTRHPAFGLSDLEDLEQELMLDLHRRISRFDPDKAGLPTFISRVLAHCAATLIEKASSPRRGGGQEIFSLNFHIARPQEGRPLELIDAISTEQALWADSKGDVGDAIHMHMDVEQVLRRLPKLPQRLAVQLLNETVTDIARNTGTPRTTIYESIKRIRAAFVAFGYRETDIRLPRRSTPFVIHFAL
ncbi:MAG: sigma-70 family RNA polymerase sigma factor [Magnetococcales bacterium]|nr:sigma-70 family RNA polymerase sigma factor [Magnetococcales bacterium]